jgi:hypothetical protein
MAKQSSIATSKEPRGGGVSYRKAGASGERIELDENYDLIGVLYHALQGAESCERYISDAEDAADQELVEFLTETRDEQIRRAARARTLLAERIYDAQEEEEEEEEEDEEDEDDDDEDEESEESEENEDDSGD